MTIQSLLLGIKQLLSDEYEKQGIKFVSETGEHVLPNIFVESLPYDLESVSFPYVLILPPVDVVDDNNELTIPLTLLFGAIHADKRDDNIAFMDIFTFVERTKAILKNNITIAGAFSLDNKSTASFDALAGQSLTVSLGELDITYKSYSSSYGGYSE